MGAAGIIGTSWIYTSGEFFAAYGAGGEIFGLAIATVLASFIAMSYAELASKFPRAGARSSTVALPLTEPSLLWVAGY